MKQIGVIAALAAAVIALPASGDEQSTMSINLNSGDVTTIALADISSVTVSGGNVIVTKTDASTASTAISSIYNITFEAAEEAGVEQVTAAEEPYAGPVEVYAVDGRLVKATTVQAGQTVSLDNLENGIYIIRTGDKATKVRKQ